MHQIRTLRKIIFIFAFALVTFGCDSNSNFGNIGNAHESTSLKAQISNDNIGINAVGLEAEAVPEGICLTFDYIPPETSWLFIYFMESRADDEKFTPYDKDTTGYDWIYTYTDIRDDALEQVRKAGKVILPYVKPGRKYFIDTYFITKDEMEGLMPIDFQAKSIKAECIPYAGIYFDNKIELTLNETLTIATLSSEPIFSAEVDYAPEKYMYKWDIDYDDAAIAILRAIDWDDPAARGNYVYNEPKGLSWDFSPVYDYEKHFFAGNEYSAYVQAYCHIMHDNLTWTVEIATSDIFNLSLK